MENICNYSFTCFISTCSCVTEYSFLLQKVNNAMSLVTLEASNESRRIQNLKKILCCQLTQLTKHLKSI